MNFSNSEEQGITVVTVNLVDATSGHANVFKDYITEVMAISNNGRVIVDLHKVHYVDSAFIGTLIYALKVASKTGVELKLTNLQPKVRATFELTRLYTVFKIFSSNNEAIVSFS